MAAALGTAGMVLAVAYFGGIEAPIEVFAGVSGAAAALCLVSSLLMRMKSRGASGLAAAMLIVAALGVLSLLALADARDKAVSTPEMAMIVWLGLGAFLLSMWVREQTSVPAVGRDGKREEAARERA